MDRIVDRILSYSLILFWLTKLTVTPVGKKVRDRVLALSSLFPVRQLRSIRRSEDIEMEIDTAGELSVDATQSLL